MKDNTTKKMKSTEVQEASDIKPAPWNRRYLKISIIVSLLGLLSVILIALFLNPADGPITILTFLLASFVLFLGINSLVVQLITAILKKRPPKRLTLSYSSFLLAIGSVFITGLLTLGQLQLVDLVLVLIFELLLNFYFIRRF